MPLVDLILIIIVGAFVVFGFFFGLVHTLGSLVGSILGIFVASRLVEPTTDKFGFLFGGGGFAKVIVFVILFVLVSRLVGLVFWLVEKVFDFISWIPFAKTLDRLLGALFGFVEGVVIVGVVIFFALQYLPDDAVKVALESSSVAKYLVAAMSALQVLFPEELRIQ